MSRAGPALRSPCVQLCVLDAAQICLGCGRSADEIGRWPQADLAEQADILSRAAQRQSRRAQTTTPDSKDKP